jgi:hypothetical protein
MKNGTSAVPAALARAVAPTGSHPPRSPRSPARRRRSSACALVFVLLLLVLLLLFNALSMAGNHTFLLAGGLTDVLRLTEIAMSTGLDVDRSGYRVPCNGTATTPTTTTTTTAMTAFDEIVETARIYTFRAPNQQQKRPPPPRRKPFDVVTWEHKRTGGLSDADRAMLGRVYGAAQSVFEYGLGESTLIAHAVGVPRYAGVDSDPTYVADTRAQVAARGGNHPHHHHYRFYFADIGPTLQWGYAKYNLTKAVWTYQLVPLLSEPDPFDVYMVDGRYRFPCLLASFLHASGSSIGSRGAAAGAESAANLTSTVVLVHDCLRETYHRADAVLDLFETSGDRLCAYRRRPDTKDSDLLRLWRRHFVESE